MEPLRTYDSNHGYDPGTIIRNMKTDTIMCLDETGGGSDRGLLELFFIVIQYYRIIRHIYPTTVHFAIYPPLPTSFYSFAPLSSYSTQFSLLI